MSKCKVNWINLTGRLLIKVEVGKGFGTKVDQYTRSVHACMSSSFRVCQAICHKNMSQNIITYLSKELVTLKKLSFIGPFMEGKTKGQREVTAFKTCKYFYALMFFKTPQAHQPAARHPFDICPGNKGKRRERASWLNVSHMPTHKDTLVPRHLRSHSITLANCFK